ncbi:MAG: protein GlmU, partial [Thermodesulfobacteriota bacterium]
TAAGSIIRKNELKNDRILLGGSFKDMSFPREYYIYKNITNIFNNNIYYIAGLISLKSWYRYIRPLFIYDNFSKALIKGMQETLDDCIKERIYRLKDFCEKLEISKQTLLVQNADKKSKSILLHNKAINQFQRADKIFKKEYEKKSLNETGEQFIKIIEEKIVTYSKDYIKIIQCLTPEEYEKGSRWLYEKEESIVEQLLI